MRPALARELIGRASVHHGFLYHYSLLRTIDESLGLTHLANANQTFGGEQGAGQARSGITVGFAVRADVAQLVEHLHGKEGVRGSSPRVGLTSIPLDQALSVRDDQARTG